MAGHVPNALAIYPHFAAITKRLAVLFAGPDHFNSPQCGNAPGEDTMETSIMGTLDFAVKTRRCTGKNRLAG
jgi:hypothetical protein